MKSSILRTVHATLVATTLAITVSAAVTTCSAKEQSQNEVGLDGTVNASHRDGAVLKRSERGPVEPDILNRDPILIAQVAGLWCYTNYGKYPMQVWVLLGSACQVNVYFYPYVLWGTAGY